MPATAPGSATLSARMLTWWMFFRISLEERLVYRGDFMLGVLMRFLPFATQVFLFWAIFETLQAEMTEPGTRLAGEIGGYSFYNLIAYLLLVTVTRAFSSMPGLTTGIARSVREGEIKKYLIQPVDMIGFLLLQRVAHKLVYYLIAFLPFAFWFFLFRNCFENLPSPEVFALYVLSLVLSFLLGYFLEACMGLIAFWYLEVGSLTFIYMLFSFFLSGHMFPLDWLPTSPFNFQILVDILPFQFLAYFPAAVFLGKVSGPEMVQGLVAQALWVLFFIVLSRVLWTRGVRRYSGFGG